MTIEEMMALDYWTLQGAAYHEFHQDDAEWSKKGVIFNCYNSLTGQVVPRIVFDQNRPFEDQLGVLEVVEHIKPSAEDATIEPAKYIAILEHTCSEYGVYSVRVLSDGTSELWKITYGQAEVVETRANLEGLLRYVYDNHPYLYKEE